MEHSAGYRHPFPDCYDRDPSCEFVLKWFEPWSTQFWIMMAAEAVGYILVWIIMYSCYKAKVRKLNETLKESQEAKTNSHQT